jgi:hypothetical protein
MGGMSSLAAVAFGIIWTIMAFTITRNAPFPLVGILFPLFGIIFIIMGVVQAIYNFTNATSENRFSTFDITGSQEEPDPLNERFGHLTETDVSGESIESRLAKVNELKSKGLISEAEYAEQRRKILSSL